MIEYSKYHSRTLMSFVDAFILMLLLGALSHTLHFSWAHYIALSYWQSLLVMWVSICIIPGAEYPVRIAKPSWLETFNENLKAARKSAAADKAAENDDDEQ